MIPVPILFSGKMVHINAYEEFMLRLTTQENTEKDQRAASYIWYFKGYNKNENVESIHFERARREIIIIL